MSGTFLNSCDFPFTIVARAPDSSWEKAYTEFTVTVLNECYGATTSWQFNQNSASSGIYIFNTTADLLNDYTINNNEKSFYLPSMTPSLPSRADFATQCGDFSYVISPAVTYISVSLDGSGSGFPVASIYSTDSTLAGTRESHYTQKQKINLVATLVNFPTFAGLSYEATKAVD